MNAPEFLPVRTAIEGAVHLPLELIAPSTTNPRRHPQDKAAMLVAWNLVELADSIKKHGVLQPILVRPHPASKEGDGRPPYELVVGERRWRASQLAGEPTIEAKVREMTDFEALEIQVIENDQREDLHPLEQAEGYHKLMRAPNGLQGYTTADELADRIGKSRRFVFNRLKLCELGPDGRAAFYEGKINASVALLIARMKDHDEQAKATAAIVQGFGGEPFSFRSAAEYLKREFMLDLGKATFDIAVVYDVAGPCMQCTKRSGAHPDLFADVGGSDMCQDSKCYQAKEAEAKQKRLAAARAAGHKVIDGDAAKRLMWSSTQTSYINGYQALDKPSSTLTDSKKPLRDILGDDLKDVVVVDHPDGGALVELVPEAAAKKALKAKGLLREEKQPAAAKAKAPAELPPMTPKELQLAKDHRAGDFFGQLAFKKMHQMITDDAQLPILGLRMAVDRLLYDLSYEATKLIYDTRGWVYPNGGASCSGDLEARVARASPRELAELLIEALISEECSEGTQLGDLKHRDTPLVDLADEYGVDLQAVQDKATLEAGLSIKAEQEKRVAAKEAAAKKPPAKTISTPPKSAAAQGTKQGPATPEEALAKAVATDQAKGTRKKVNQKDETAKLPMTNGAAKNTGAPTKGIDQKDKPAKPAVQLSGVAAWPFPTGAKP